MGRGANNLLYSRLTNLNKEPAWMKGLKPDLRSLYAQSVNVYNSKITAGFHETRTLFIRQSIPEQVTPDLIDASRYDEEYLTNQLQLYAADKQALVIDANNISVDKDFAEIVYETIPDNPPIDFKICVNAHDLAYIEQCFKYSGQWRFMHGSNFLAYFVLGDKYPSALCWYANDVEDYRQSLD